MVVIGDLEFIEGTLNLRKRSVAVARKPTTSTTSNAQRAIAARTLVTSNTGLPGAFKAPEPPPTKTLNKRDPFARREPAPPSTPITSNQMAPVPTPSPAPVEVVAMPGSGGGGGAYGGGGIQAEAAPDASMVDFTKATSTSLVTPTNIAIGVVGLIGLVIVAKKVL